MATTVITNYQASASSIAALGGTSGLQFQATATRSARPAIGAVEIPPAI